MSRQDELAPGLARRLAAIRAGVIAAAGFDPCDVHFSAPVRGDETVSRETPGRGRALLGRRHEWTPEEVELLNRLDAAPVGSAERNSLRLRLRLLGKSGPACRAKLTRLRKLRARVHAQFSEGRSA